MITEHSTNTTLVYIAWTLYFQVTFITVPLWLYVMFGYREEMSEISVVCQEFLW